MTKLRRHWVTGRFCRSDITVAARCKVVTRSSQSQSHHSRNCEQHLTLSVCIVVTERLSSPIQSNNSMHHYECVALCKDITVCREADFAPDL